MTPPTDLIRLSPSDRPASEANGELSLSWDQRRKSRLRATLNDGRDVAIVLARGACLRTGDVLASADGSVVVEVSGAPETVSTATATTAADLVRAAYHLGNRHVPVQLGPAWVRYQHDHVLDGMVEGLGLSVSVEQAVFSPEGGAYGDAGGHRHAHSSRDEAEPSADHPHSHAHAHTSRARAAAVRKDHAGSQSAGAASPVLALLTLCSPTLPIGGFSWSDGLESAVTAGQVHTKDTAASWISGRLIADIAHLELPLLLRLCTAWRAGDQDEVERLNAWLAASRETAELAASSIAMGRALARLLADLGSEEAAGWRDRDDAELVTLFALAVTDAGLSTRDALLGYAWSWLDTQVAAAIKLVPLGQTDGQRLLRDAHVHIRKAVSIAQSLADDDIGFSMPGLAIASARHERQRVRLFRS